MVGKYSLFALDYKPGLMYILEHHGIKKKAFIYKIKQNYY